MARRDRRTQADDAAASVASPCLPDVRTERFIALVRILAERSYAAGEEIPAALAADGLTEGEHWRRE